MSRKFSTNSQNLKDPQNQIIAVINYLNLYHFKILSDIPCIKLKYPLDFMKEFIHSTA